MDLDVLTPYWSDPGEVEHPSQTWLAVYQASGFPHWSEGMGWELAGILLADRELGLLIGLGEADSMSQNLVPRAANSVDWTVGSHTVDVRTVPLERHVDLVLQTSPPGSCWYPAQMAHTLKLQGRMPSLRRDLGAGRPRQDHQKTTAAELVPADCYPLKMQ